MIARLLPTSSSLVLAISGAQAAAPTPDASSRIDTFIEKALEAAGKKPMPAASSEIFVRRIYLDIAGRTPTLAEAQAFLADDSVSSRVRLIDHLLGSEAYVHHFYSFWG